MGMSFAMKDPIVAYIYMGGVLELWFQREFKF